MVSLGALPSKTSTSLFTENVGVLNLKAFVVILHLQKLASYIVHVSTILYILLTCRSRKFDAVSPTPARNQSYILPVETRPVSPSPIMGRLSLADRPAH